MELTILILILPLLSFLILGIGGKWMKPAHAGLLGTLSLSLVTLLSYATAWLYFTSPRTAEGVYENAASLQLYLVTLYANPAF